MDGLTKIIAVPLLCFALLCGCAVLPDPGDDDPAGATAVPRNQDFSGGTPVPDPGTTVTTVTTVTAAPTRTPCSPGWSCSNWSSCNTSGIQVRSCTDRNACNFSGSLPAVSQACTYTPALPPGGPYALSITGDTVCRQTAENAVNNLKYRASPDYEFFRKYVGAVNCTYPDFCYYSTYTKGQEPYYTVCIAPLVDPPTIFIDAPFWSADPVWLAGVFVHEACHSEGYREYILNEGADYDLTEFSDWKFERRCCDRMRTTWNQLGAPAYNDDLYRYCSL